MADEQSGIVSPRRWQHRTRRFAREVASVVLGVLIALGIGEAADWVRWQVRVAQSRTSILKELAEDRTYLEKRLHMHGCIEHRLGEIDAILRRARTTRVLPDVGKLGGPARRPILRVRYDAAVSEGLLSHLPTNEAHDLAILFVMMDEARAQANAEFEAWTTSHLMTRSAGRVDDNTLSSLLQAANSAANDAFWVNLADGQVRDAIAARHVIAAPDTILGSDHPIRYTGPDAPSVCQPLLVDGKPFTPELPGQR